MALLNRRKKNTDVLPEEVREYYQAEKRQKAGVAWVLALGTLLVTFLVAGALFFGGRWAYRAIFDKDDKPTTSQSQDQDSTDSSIDSSSAANNAGGQTSSASTNTPSTTTNPGASTNTTTPAPAPTPAAPTPGLVNTGPGDEE